MTTRLTHQAIAFSLAAFVTLGVLAGLNGLAHTEFSAAHSELAQAAVVAQPA